MTSGNQPSELPLPVSPYAKPLVHALLPYSVSRLYSVNERLQPQENNLPVCYLIEEGSVGLYRRNDDKLLHTTKGEMIVGLGSAEDPFMSMYCKALTPCKIGVLTTARAHEIIGEKQLWELLSKHVTYVSNRFYEYILQMTVPTAYELMRIQLFELMNESEEFRQNTTAEKYIRDKTHLSRSGVMRILAELRTGGYVEMEEGKLVKINKLPAKY
ncbi:Crp/Fnr family transcriptional regulator [Enterobacteriaceae bacterium 89]|nr:Crp/Fnr family transcriptional regulator [Enterobacteriaceae bacterium 89]